MWLTANYSPTTFFSLKPASATSTGGKSLLCPTPFALKMALLDVAIRVYGLIEGQQLFPALRSLRIAFQAPNQAVVNNTFTKILKPPKNKPEFDPDLNLTIPLINTIAFREYISFHGELVLAFQGMPNEQLTPLLLNLNYLGKRGGFIQLQTVPQPQNWADDDLLPNGYTLLTESTSNFPVDGLLQMLDDCGPKMTFEQANIYSGKSIKLGKERILHHVVLPYRLVRSSKGYSYYERIAPA
jgi:hypothetical protein